MSESISPRSGADVETDLVVLFEHPEWQKPLWAALDRRGVRYAAFDLKQAWPEVDLRVVADAGHAMTEPGLINELVAATKSFATLS